MNPRVNKWERYWADWLKRNTLKFIELLLPLGKAAQKTLLYKNESLRISTMEMTEMEMIVA